MNAVKHQHFINNVVHLQFYRDFQTKSKLIHDKQFFKKIQNSIIKINIDQALSFG